MCRCRARSTARAGSGLSRARRLARAPPPAHSTTLCRHGLPYAAHKPQAPRWLGWRSRGGEERLAVVCGAGSQGAAFLPHRPPPASPPPPSLFVQLWPQRDQVTIAFHVTREPTQRCGGTKPCVCVCVCVDVQDSLFDELSYENSMRMMGQMGQPTQLHPLQVRRPPPFRLSLSR